MSRLSSFLFGAAMAVVPCAMLAVVLLYAGSFYSISKSRERTACYERAIEAKNYSANCGERNWIERVMYRIATGSQEPTGSGS